MIQEAEGEGSILKLLICRSNKWHREGDSQGSCTEGSKSDHTSKDAGEWNEGERKPFRGGSKFESPCHGDGSELP